jgi:hypothetical protein
MNLNEFVFKYKKAIVIAGINIVGLVIILLVVSLIRGATAGSIPSVNASAVETVDFLANPAMALQPKEKRMVYVNQLIQVYAESPQKREAFVQAINNLSDSDIAQLQDNVFEIVKDQVVEDAKEFARLQTPEQKQRFVKEKVGQMMNLQGLLCGKNDGGSSGTITKGGKAGSMGPDLRASKINRGIPSDPAAVYSKVLDQSNPSERSKIDSYISSVQIEVGNIKKASKIKKK